MIVYVEENHYYLLEKSMIKDICIVYDYSKRNLGRTTLKNSKKEFNRVIKTLRKLNQSKTICAIVVRNVQKQEERI